LSLDQKPLVDLSRLAWPALDLGLLTGCLDAPLSLYLRPLTGLFLETSLASGGLWKWLSLRRLDFGLHAVQVFGLEPLRFGLSALAGLFLQTGLVRGGLGRRLSFRRLDFSLRAVQVFGLEPLCFGLSAQSSLFLLPLVLLDTALGLGSEALLLRFFLLTLPGLFDTPLCFSLSALAGLLLQALLRLFDAGLGLAQRALAGFL
jgi:hypothetical protein